MSLETPAPGVDADPSAPYRRIAAAAGRGELVIATSAELGLRIKRALDDPDCSDGQAARLIQAEPLLAARVVAVANSAAYNPAGRAIADLRQAVARLGFRCLRSLTLSMLVQRLSGQPGDPEQKARARQLWEHTAHVSALAHVIARRVTHQDPEAALLAGILHEVAGFYLLACAQKEPELLTAAFPGWQGNGENLVGTELFKVLEIPGEIVGAIDDLWQGFLAHPPSSLGDTLLLAEQLAPVPSPLYWAPGKDVASRAGVPHIEILIDRETLSGILAESAGEVRSLIDALK